ncbi:unnamed protein product [Leuciscus chuanchicus]
MPAPAESFLRSEGAWAEANYASLYPARFIENTNTYMTVDKHVAPFSQSAKRSMGFLCSYLAFKPSDTPMGHMRKIYLCHCPWIAPRKDVSAPISSAQTMSHHLFWGRETN